MSDQPTEQPPSSESIVPAAAPLDKPDVLVPLTPPSAPVPVVSLSTQPPIAVDNRRDFFGDAMRETLAPFTGLIERRLQPLLAALEALPTEVERFTNNALPVISAVLDQPQSQSVSLPIAEEPTHAPRVLRPPGAMKPGEFEAVCSACGKCVDACPAQAIKLDLKGAMGGGQPYIVALEQPCVVCTDLSCMPACPTGALRQMDRFHLGMGTAGVDHGLCLRDNGEDCTLCVDVCPITREGTSPLGDAIFIQKESGKVRVRKNVCTGCGLCESRCPTNPPAITVTPYVAPFDPIIA